MHSIMDVQGILRSILNIYLEKKRKNKFNL
jgi:hypothetical protein